MSAFTEEPRKFLPSEWLLTNQVQYGNAEAECSRSERVIASSKALVEETDKATQRMQQDVNKKLEQRIHNVRFWKEELNRELDEMTREMEELQTFRTRVEKALESCSEPLQVTQQCLTEREKHEGTELVHDEAELELRKEKEVIEGAICLLQRTLEQTDEQMRMNRSAMYSLKKDLQDKVQAEKIDDFCSVLTTTSPRLFQNKEEYRSVPGTPVTPEGWENFSSVNIGKAKGQKNSSQSLRALVERVLEQTAADMRRQHQASAAALQLCIQRTKSSKEQLEDHLNQVLAEISGQEKNLVS
ncbi:hypothetical protein AGOR_G00171010 [Albula goreensis]|uniref:Tektin n=1 Tax=Albula goreensis TaxID=1534307 RepID=A0A8T3D6A3_9TELE|nr:hypothetical protein AGOR_G00171010 [Albula goreensis]